MARPARLHKETPRVGRPDLAAVTQALPYQSPPDRWRREGARGGDPHPPRFFLHGEPAQIR